MQMHDAAERFWSKVAVRGEDECWLWQAGTNGAGLREYGRFSLNGKPEQAHRVAFLLTHGSWPNECRHSCDTPRCCNPKHLLDGTRSDNMKDASSRGRLNFQKNPNLLQRGEAHAMHKLTEAEVRQIKQMTGLSRRKLGLCSV